ncbi:MAG: DEAD/DEAH box helicase [bacterium]
MVRRILRNLGHRLFGLGLKKPAVRNTHAVPASARGPASVVDAATQHHKRPLRHEAAVASAPHARKSAPPHINVWKRSDYVVPAADGKTRFADLALPDELVHAVADLKFVYASEIQAMTLPHTLAGKDVAGRAQTGTGKTAAFLLTIFTHFQRHPQVARSRGAPRALVLAPTRELAVQIEKDAEEIGRYLPFKALAVYGGMDYAKQQTRLDRENPELIVATPGRLLDFRSRGCLDLRHVEILVIDEADRMLDMGFIPDVRTIVYATPRREDRQTLLFSATMTDDILRLASSWTNNPMRLEVKSERVTVDLIEQFAYLVSHRHKFALLYNLIESKHLERVLVFCNRRDQTDRLFDHLRHYGINVDMLSGDVEQGKRLKVLDAFRAGRVRVLVATDVAGRGLQVDGISHVINYDIPFDPENYVHRIGRTGRAGASGTAITFACEDESFDLPAIEQYIGQPLTYVNPEPALLTLPPPPPGSPPLSPPKPRQSGSYGRVNGGGMRGRRPPPRR